MIGRWHKVLLPGITLVQHRKQLEPVHLTRTDEEDTEPFGRTVGARYRAPESCTYNSIYDWVEVITLCGTNLWSFIMEVCPSGPLGCKRLPLPLHELEQPAAD